MQTRLLEHFIIVAELGSITKASEILDMDPSTLGKQLRQLFKEYNCELYTVKKTSSQQICLTPEGQRIYQHAKAMKDQNNVLRNDLTDLKDKIKKA